MRALFMGKDKPIVVDGLRLLAERGVDTAGVVGPAERGALAGAADRLGLRYVAAETVYDEPWDDVDLVLSFVFWKRIRRPLIELPRLGCVNFHAAPLPEYRGWGVYNFGVYESAAEWAVTAHLVEEDFDTGAIVAERRFPVEPGRETAGSLAKKCEPYLLTVLGDVLDLATSGNPLPRRVQGPGRYLSREATEALREIRPNDSPEEIDRKIRAFWHPPYPGATVTLNGKTYTLVNDAILRQLGPSDERARS